MVRVILPYHLQTLAKTRSEVLLDVPPPVTQRSILDALEAMHPVLCGTVREYITFKRRPLIRFFACEEDISLVDIDATLPSAIANGDEPFYIIGAIAGG